MTTTVPFVGVSPETKKQMADCRFPHANLVTLRTSTQGLSINATTPADSVQIVWRRQHDRTAWVTAVVEHLPQVQWVHTDTVGIDRLPLSSFAQREITLSNARGAHTPAVAEWALGAMIMLAKQMPRTVINSSARQWVPRADNLLLDGRSVMILGLGDIGRRLAVSCRALGMRVYGVSLGGGPVPNVQRVMRSDAPWRELLQEVTFVVNCLPFTPSTENLLNRSIFENLSSPAYLINVGRGETVMEDDMVAAVRSGSLTGAVLDATRREPPPSDSPLWSCPEIVISPHTSSFTDATERRTRELFVSELLRHSQGIKPCNVIDLVKGY